MKNSDEEHLIVGNYYRVPCLVEEIDGKIQKIIPVYNNYHNDVESGQKEFHYHLDTRFVAENNYVITKTVEAILLPFGIRFGKEGFKKEIWVLQAQKEFHSAVTPISYIKKHLIKLSGKKVKNCNICPHKGYNLEGVREYAGIKTCPLHGLSIDVLNKRVLEYES